MFPIKINFFRVFDFYLYNFYLKVIRAIIYQLSVSAQSSLKMLQYVGTLL